MKTLNQQYEAAKNKAFTFMQKGQISAYIKALAEMNTYKNMMTAIVAN
jgi:hypothetical protein